MKKLSVANFKSLKDLSLDCSRINLFIGEPNTGKSNILEVIGLLSHFSHGNLEDFIRFESYTDLFYDEIFDNEIVITYDDEHLNVSYAKDALIYNIYKNNKRVARLGSSPDTSYYGRQRISQSKDIGLDRFKFYKYMHLENYPDKNTDYLIPPFGKNMTSIILTNEYIKLLSTNIFQQFGYRLIIEQPQRRIRILKQQGDIFILFPYSLTADTLQSFIFYLTAIKSNKNSIIAFNEPEARAFPYYIKQLAESIAHDENNNQYFITTHNPYLLISILEKAPLKHVNIFITYMDDYKTRLNKLTNKEKSNMLEEAYDPFFNINKYVKK